MQRAHNSILTDATNRAAFGSRLKQDVVATPQGTSRSVLRGETPSSAARETALIQGVANESPAGTLRSRRVSTTPKALFGMSPTPRASSYLLREVSREDAPHLTVILDLDETLVSNRRADLPQAILRPYVIETLEALRSLSGVEIVLWTASTEETGAPVVAQLQGHRKVFDDIIYRNDKWFTEPIHTKDLRLLGRDMSKVVVFDNAPNCCKLNPMNAVLVEDFTGHCYHDDKSLVNLFRIVQVLVSHTAMGHSVGEILRHLANATFAPEQLRDLLHEVHIPLPETWSHVTEAHLRGIDPLNIPPRGNFFRVPSGIKK